MSSKRNLFVSVLFLIATAFLVASCVHKTGDDDTRTPAAVTSRPAMIKPTVLIGNIPGAYLGKDKTKFYLGMIEIAPTRIITVVAPLTTITSARQLAAQYKDTKTVIFLSDKGDKAAAAKDFDAIYPGLLNLHNHTKQNVLHTWPNAVGQFQNRFEWRDWGVYKKSVSQNMNPWISYAGLSCASFRWSSLQNMINGTIFLQGPSSCLSGFGIYKVEDPGAYVSKKAGVQAPTDLVYPNEMAYVWQVLKKDIEAGKTYEDALYKDLKRHCIGGEVDKITKGSDVNSTDGLKVLSKKENLEKSCIATPQEIQKNCKAADIDKLKLAAGDDVVKRLSKKSVLDKKCYVPVHSKFVRYVYFIHKTIAGKKEFAKAANRSAIIAHLAEGRRLDPYNQTEYQMIKLLGLNQPYVNFIHGVGLRGTGKGTAAKDDYVDMAKNKMGLIWSPYSNLLLYGETLDIEAAHTAGVTLGIGSDWVPTGTKSVLEEIKLAAAYVDQMKTRDGKKKLNTIFNDEYLFKMMTENSAKMINHWGSSEGEAGVGQIAVGSMGSVIAVAIQHQNPFTNIVRHATEREINLVVVDGSPIYGNVPYLQQAGLSSGKYEIFSKEISIENKTDADKMVESIPKPDLAKLKPAPEDDSSDEESNSEDNSFVNTLVANVSSHASDYERKDNCKFTIPKAFVTPDTKAIEKDVDKLNKQGLDLDKVSDIQLILAASSMSQSLNRLSPDKGDPTFAMSYFPNLYTCSDSEEKHAHRYKKYVSATGADELSKNIAPATRTAQRTVKGFPKTAEKLATEYGLKWEVK